MLARKYRLVKKNDLKSVFDGGRCALGRLLKIRYLRTDLPNCRFTVVVSLKVSKKANKRNLLKRRLRKIIYENLSNFKHNFDIIVFVLPRAAEAKYQELEQELSVILKKIRIW